MGYIAVPITTEPVDLADEAFAYLEAQVPGWLPSPGNLEAWLIESLAQLAAELRELAQLVPDSIFQFYGSSILGLPPYAAVQATGSTTWTAIDTAGYTVTAGTLVALTPPGSTTSYAFAVARDFSFTAGSNVAAGVEIQAVDAGAAASGLTGTVQTIDSLDFVETVTLDAPTSGGQDAEATDAYLARLADLFTLLTPRPILPHDFAVLAQRTSPAVSRATAIDLYKADTATAGVPRCVTVVCVDDAGQALAPTDKAAVLAMLQTQREVNFLVYVADPTYTVIDVQCTVKVYAGYDPAATAALVVANLTHWLSPGSWGVPPFGDTSAQSWINDTVVRYLEVSEQINRTDGVWYVETLQLRKAGGSWGTADVPLTGVAPLPQPGAITATGNL